MKGDFTRDTFDPKNHFSRVLMQQGRVTLDADYNEQASILLHYLRTLARDLIGPYAAPADNDGFTLSFDANQKDLKIGAGRYYVDGILVENNNQNCFYSTQPGYIVPQDDQVSRAIATSKGAVFWMYLDVWERHITSIEDDNIREKALNGPDTCSRAQVVWQVKGQLQDGITSPTGDALSKLDCGVPKYPPVALSKAYLAARVNPGQKVTDACVTPPDSKYRGTENQLYRIEIHNGSDSATGPTLKWSRDNGSVATAWLGMSSASLLVKHSRGFQAGDWVELSDDTSELQGACGVLVKLAKVEGDLLSVDPATGPPPQWNQLVNPKVRRWNQTANDKTTLAGGAVPITESPTKYVDNNSWIDLEDGIQIQFEKGGVYRTGDYWLIPARVATGNIEWPVTMNGGAATPDFKPPDGVEHHYAPLGFVWWDTGSVFQQKLCGCTFKPSSNCWKAKNT